MLKVRAYGEPVEKAILRFLYESDLNLVLPYMQNEYEDIVIIMVSSEFFILSAANRSRPNIHINHMTNNGIREKVTVTGIRGPPIT